MERISLVLACVTLPAQHQLHLVAWTSRMPSLLVRI